MLMVGEGRRVIEPLCNIPASGHLSPFLHPYLWDDMSSHCCPSSPLWVLSPGATTTTSKCPPEDGDKPSGNKSTPAAAAADDDDDKEDNGGEDDGEEDEEDSDDEEGAAGGEPRDDFSLAWEMLELAKTLFVEVGGCWTD